MIKLEALRVFVTVAEIGNIRDAADRLGRTPSAVSMALKQLEEELGSPLFETDRKNALTTLGQFALDLARTQIRSYDGMLRSIRAFAQNRIGRLTLASVPSVAAHLLPGLLQSFIAERRGVEVELSDVDSAAVARLVERGDVDLGIAGRPGALGALSFRPLFRDRFRLVAAASSALAALGRPIGWDDLAARTLIVNGASAAIASPEYRRLAEASTMTVRNVTSLMALVGADVGVTLLPALSTAALPAGTVALDLADPSAGREVGLVQLRGRAPSPVAASFVALFLAELPRLTRRFDLQPVAATAADAPGRAAGERPAAPV